LGAAGRALNLTNPTGLPWTWLMERLRWIAHGITVASRFLERRFGGTLIPHVRDTDAWTPGGADPLEARRGLGVAGERVVMALGRPIVSTRVSMIPEILDGSGLLVPPGDVAALADAIRRLLDHPEEAAALGGRARARCVAEYSFAAARRKLFPLVERVMARSLRT